MTRFDAYEVSPVLATDIDGIGGTEIQAFGTLAEAVTNLAETEAAGPGEGAEAIADFTTEADAFALLYKLTGIAGQTGVTLYRLPHPQTMTVWTCTSQADFEPTTIVHAQEHDAQAELLGRMRLDLYPRTTGAWSRLAAFRKGARRLHRLRGFRGRQIHRHFNHYAVEPHGLVL